MKVLAAENTPNHAGTCPSDARCHIPPTYLGAPSQPEPSTTLLNFPPFYTNNTSIKIHKINLSCMHFGMCWLWPESGHWVEILRQHPSMTTAIAEALDVCLLRGSQSSPPHR